jgi:hypothetical protein
MFFTREVYEVSIVTSKNKNMFWLWGLVAVVLLGLCGYLYFRTQVKPKTPAVIKKTKVVTEKVTVPELTEVIEEDLKPATEKEATEPVLTKEDYCAELKKRVVDYLDYLNQKKYVKKICHGSNIHTRFEPIIKLLAAHPPVPPGEKLTPEFMPGNVFHLFRTLPTRDIFLIKKIVKKEQDDLEVVLDIFYDWLTAGDKCPDTFLFRPDTKLVYNYAVFFLDTAGGRACLLRRSEKVRVLLNYYCVSIINNADKMKENRFGINIVPHILILRKKIRTYPDFIYQDKYITALNNMETGYSSRP